MASSDAHTNREMEMQIQKITWGNLREFHRQFCSNESERFYASGQEHFCNGVLQRPTQKHFNQCRLAQLVLRVAENVWNEMSVERSGTGRDNSDVVADDDAVSDEDLVAEEVPRIGLSSENSSHDAPAPAQIQFTASNVMRLNFDDTELINYAATVIWTWWTVHSCKDFDNLQAEAVDALIRRTLLQEVNRRVTDKIEEYEYALSRMNENDKGYSNTQQKLKATTSYWRSVLHPTFKPLSE